MEKTLVRVLVIDDNPADVIMLRAGLDCDEMTQFQVTTAEQLSQGLETLREMPIDVVLLDLNLPDSVGLETFERLHSPFPEVPIVVLSGLEDSAVAIASIQHGAQDYVVKGQGAWQIAARAVRYAAERNRFQSLLHAQADKFKTLIEHSSDGLALVSADGEILYQSPAGVQILGYAVSEVIGHLTREFILPEDVGIAAELFQRVIRHPREPLVMEFRCLAKNGRPVWLDATVNNLLDAPEIQAIVVNYRDITERQKVERALRTNEQILRMFVEHAPAAIAMFDRDMKYLVTSRRFLENYGLLEQNVIGRTHYQVFPEIPERWKEIHRRCLAGATEYCSEDAFPHANGQVDWVKWEIRPWYDDTDQIGGLMLFSELINERKHAEERLYESERFSKATLDALSEHICVVDEKGTVVFVNRAWREFADANPPLVPDYGLGVNYLAVCDAATGTDAPIAHKFSQGIREVMEGKTEEWSAEYPCHSPNKEHWFICRVTRFWGQGPMRLVISHQNITERKQAEELLHASEEQYRKLVAASPDGIVIIGLDNRVSYVSSKVLELGGFQNEAEILGHSVLDWIIPSDRDKAVADMSLVLHGFFTKENEYRLVKKGGALFWGEVNAALLTDAHGGPSGIVLTIRDISERKQVQQALRESEEMFRTVFNNSPIGLQIFDKEGVLKQCNAKACEMFGADRNAIIGLFNLRDDPNYRYPEIWEQLDRGQVVQHEIEFDFSKTLYQTIQTGIRYYFVITIPISEAVSNTIGYIMQTIDITERKQAEKAVRESEERFRQLSDNIEEEFWVYDWREQRIIYANPAHERIWGHANSVTYQNASFFLNAIHPLDLDFVKSQLQRESRGEPVSMEYRIIRPDGTMRWIWDRAYPVCDVSGQFVRTVGVALDITDRKLAEEKLRKSEQELRQAQHIGKIGNWELDVASGRMTYSDEMYELFEWDPRLGPPSLSRALEYLHPEDVPDANQYFQRAIETGMGFEDDARIQLPDGRQVWHRSIGATIMDSKGKVIKVYGTTQDVTERKQAEEALRERMEDLAFINALNQAVNRGDSLDAVAEVLAVESRRIFQCRDAAIYLLTLDRRHLELRHINLHQPITSAIEKLIGARIPPILLELTEASIATQVLQSEEGIIISDPQAIQEWVMEFVNTSFLPDAMRPFVRQLVPQICKLINIRSIISIPLKSSGQAVGIMELASERLFTEQDLKRLQNIRAQLSEIVLRKQAEESLMESKDKYRRLSEVLEIRVAERTAEAQDLYNRAPIGYHSLDRDGRIVMVNQTELDWLGYTREEMLGHSITEWLTPASIPGFQKEFELLLKQGWVRDAEVDFICRDGKIMPVVVNAVAQFDEHGKFVMTRSTLFDNTERKKVQDALRASRDELNVANMELARASRLKDEFLANMSHELRTPLNAILGLSESLIEQYIGPLNDKQIKALTTVQASGQHLLQLINDILDLSKIEAGAMTLNVSSFSPKSTCEASLMFIKELAQKKSIHTSLEFDSDVTWMVADERRLKQMLVNLLNNAVKFTPPGGQVGLLVSGDKENDWVHLVVWDTGIGIGQADIQHLFKPFVQLDGSLTRQHEGTGLGLSLVARMAEIHGGSVQVSSEPGSGSRFTITLPWTKAMRVSPRLFAEAVVKREREKVSQVVTQTDTNASVVLIAEDNEASILTLTVYLHAQGHRVIVARNGSEAIEMACAERPALVLMDLQMPVMDGLEAIQHLRQHPDAAIATIPIIALTALAMPGDRERSLAAGANEYMTKPVNLKNLNVLIEQYLKHI